MKYKEPWSKKHKSITGGLPYSFSNSFSEPLTSDELINYSLARGDEEIVNEFYKHSLSYTPNGGSLDLREEVAKFYGPQIGADNILIFAGGQVALQTAAYALLDSDSHTIVFTPGYQSGQHAPEHASSQTTKIKLYAKNRWRIDPEEVEAAIKGNTRYMVINEPFNPAGTLMKADVQEKLISIMQSVNGEKEINEISDFIDDLFKEEDAKNLMLNHLPKKFFDDIKMTPENRNIAKDYFSPAIEDSIMDDLHNILRIVSFLLTKSQCILDNIRLEGLLSNATIFPQVYYIAITLTSIVLRICSINILLYAFDDYIFIAFIVNCHNILQVADRR